MDKYGKIFEQLYTEKIYPDLKKAEKVRRKILLNYSIIGSVLFGGMLVEAITWMSIAIVIIILFVLVYTRWYGIPVSAYEKLYIQAITQNIITYLNPALQIDYSSHLKLSELKSARVLSGLPEYFAGKNLIYGNIENKALRISEIIATSKYLNENGIEYTNEYFNALILIQEIDPIIEGNLIITSDANVLKHDDLFQKLTPELTSNEIELQFYAEGDKTKKLYATPSLLKILSEYKLQSGKDILYSVHENSVCLAVLNARRFTYLDPSVFSSAYNKNAAELYFKDLMFLVGAMQIVHSGSEISYAEA